MSGRMEHILQTKGEQSQWESVQTVTTPTSVRDGLRNRMILDEKSAGSTGEGRRRHRMNSNEKDIAEIKELLTYICTYGLRSEETPMRIRFRVKEIVEGWKEEEDKA